MVVEDGSGHEKIWLQILWQKFPIKIIAFIMNNEPFDTMQSCVWGAGCHLHCLDIQMPLEDACWYLHTTNKQCGDLQCFDQGHMTGIMMGINEGGGIVGPWRHPGMYWIQGKIGQDDH